MKKLDFDCAVFDFDGTLADTSEGIFASLRYAFSELNIPEPPLEIMRGFIGPSLFCSFHETLGLDEETSARAVDKYREYYRPKGVLMCGLYDGIRELLNELRARGITLCVASGKPQPQLERVTEHLGIAGMFAAVVGTDSLDRTNDKSGILRAAVRGERPVMVGDAVYDVRAALQTGVISVAAAYGFTDRKKLEAEKPDFIVDSVAELKKLLTE